VISAADYVVEPPDLWTSCLSSDRWGDAIPHVARQSDGVERWVIGGTVRNQVPLAQVGALLPQRFEEPRSWADVPEAAYSPKRRLEAMDRDGVEISVLYPGAPGYGGEAFAAIVEPELEIECCRAYNDWLLETWGGSPRFVPQCLLPISSVEASRAELERAVNRGHRGAVMHPFPWHARPDVPHIHDTAWDPLWDAAQGLGVPLCWEAGAGFMLDVYPGFEPAPRSAYTWQQSQLEKEQIPRPSEVFHRQCYVTTWFEKAGLKQRDFIGVDNILWQVGFPGSSSTYPETQAAVRENLGDLPDVERQKIIRDNAAKLYGLT
jgi:predicted TIM-barrel fold metal-dependent hydrolase